MVITDDANVDFKERNFFNGICGNPVDIDTGVPVLGIFGNQTSGSGFGRYIVIDRNGQGIEGTVLDHTHLPVPLTNVGCVIQYFLTVGRESKSFGRPNKQWVSQFFFQISDGNGNAGGGNIQIFGRLRERAGLMDLQKVLKLLKRHDFAPFSIIITDKQPVDKVLFKRI